MMLTRRFPIFVFLFFFWGTDVQSKTFTIGNGDVKALIDAIVEASKNDDEDIIVLAKNGLYELKSSYGSVKDGTNDKGGIGLPTIKGSLVIRGNGATISRLTSAGKFRIFYTATNAKITIENLTIQNGSSDTEGAGIYQGYDGQITLNSVKFFNNTARGMHGGAVFFKSKNIAKVDKCEFKNNQARDYGGAVSCLLSDLTMTNCIFENNKTTATATSTKHYPEGQGGGLQIDGGRGDNGKLVIRNCKFTNNRARVGGGGIGIFLYNNNSLVVDQCELNQNQITETKDSALGGGISYGSGSRSNKADGYLTNKNTAKAVFSNCTWYANVSSRQSGGIFVGRASTNAVQINNCTFANNESKNGVGGAIENMNGNLEIKNCTFANNISTGTGAAIRNNSSSAKVSISNTIFSNNKGANNINHYGGPSGTFVDKGNNLHFHATNTGTGGLPSNIKRADPLLENLANNGGSTKTMALKAGSPAIDAGNNCTTTDQRGQARVGKCDIGAFELVKK
jgi:hypothetical protein